MFRLLFKILIHSLFCYFKIKEYFPLFLKMILLLHHPNTIIIILININFSHPIEFNIIWC